MEITRLPSPVPRQMLTEEALPLDVATSCLPSPSKSPTTTPLRLTRAKELMHDRKMALPIAEQNVHARVEHRVGRDQVQQPVTVHVGRGDGNGPAVGREGAAGGEASVAAPQQNGDTLAPVARDGEIRLPVVVEVGDHDRARTGGQRVAGADAECSVAMSELDSDRGARWGNSSPGRCRRRRRGRPPRSTWDWESIVSVGALAKPPAPSRAARPWCCRLRPPSRDRGWRHR